LEVTLTGTRKCDCSFKLQDKLVARREGWVSRVICDTHNHELSNTVVGHLYADRLKENEHSMIIDMTKSLVKLTNILF